MARRKPAAPVEGPVVEVCTCRHPRARHWRGAEHPPVCLHGQINPGDPCACRAFTAAAAA